MSRKDWEGAPLAPFMVARVCWRAQDPQRDELNLTAWSWRGWMFEPLADWTGAMESIESMSPAIEGASLTIDWACDKQGLDLRETDGGFILFARQASGRAAPWLPSEEWVHQQMDTPRLVLIDMVVEVRDIIPREWDQSWHDRWSEKIVGEFGGLVEHRLASLGFCSMESLGIHDDLSGDHHWGNVAQKMAPGWLARKEARELRESTHGESANSWPSARI